MGPEDFGGHAGSTTFYRPGSATSLVNVAGDGHTWYWEPSHGGLLTTDLGVNLGATLSDSPENRVLASRPDDTLFSYRPDGAPSEVPFDTNRSLRGIAASSDGNRFVVVYSNGLLELRDTASAALVSKFAQEVETLAVDHSALVRLDIMIAIDRSGTRVAFQANDHRIYILGDNRTTVKTIDPLSSQRVDLQTLDLSDDGSELVVSTKVGEAIWYDIPGGGVKSIAPPSTEYDAQFVSGDRVAVIGRGGAQIIDPRSSQPTKSIALGPDSTRLAVDGTGRLLATVDATGSIQLWDANLAARIGAPLQIRNVSSSAPIRFTADGHYLLVSGPKEVTWVDVWSGDWPHLACSLAKEKLSPDERARFLGSPAAPNP